MEVTLIIKSIMGLVVILAILMFLFFYKNKTKKEVAKVKVKTSSPQKSTKKDLKSLHAIIKMKSTTAKELQETLDLVIKYYGVIPKRVDESFKIYMNILFTICRHPNTNKDIIIKFNRELDKLNPSYKAEINDAITKGLNSRG